MSFLDDKDSKDDDDTNMDEEEKYGADDSRKELEKEDEKASHEGSCFLLGVFFNITLIIYLALFFSLVSKLNLFALRSETADFGGQPVRHPVLPAAAAQPLRGVEEPSRGSAQPHSPARALPT
jgi:hypothetical protein